LFAEFVTTMLTAVLVVFTPDTVPETVYVEFAVYEVLSVVTVIVPAACDASSGKAGAKRNARDRMATTRIAVLLPICVVSCISMFTIPLSFTRKKESRGSYTVTVTVEAGEMTPPCGVTT